MQTIHGAEMQIPDIIVRLHQDGTGGMPPWCATVLPRNFALTALHLLQMRVGREKVTRMAKMGRDAAVRANVKLPICSVVLARVLQLLALSTLMLKLRLKSLIFSLRICAPSTSTC